MQNASFETKRIAISNFIFLIKNSETSDKKSSLIELIISTFLKSKNYHDRLLFIDIFHELSTFLSRKILSCFLFPKFFDLGIDKVSNVRLKYIKCLEITRKFIINDEECNLEKFNENLNFLKKDKNEEISKVFLIPY